MVYVHLATGFEEVEALTTVDVLRRAGIETKTVSITGEKLVVGTHDIPVQADLLFEEADYDSCEMIVLPGGLPGATNLGGHSGLTEHCLRRPYVRHIQRQNLPDHRSACHSIRPDRRCLRIAPSPRQAA